MKSAVSFIVATLFFTTAFCGTVPRGSSAKLYVWNLENVLGTSLQLKVKASSEKNAAIAEAAALKEITRISKLLSAYDANSEFSRWLATKNTAIKVSPELFEVLSMYDKWRMKTDGALDASAQVITKLWKQSAVKQAIPSQQELAIAVDEVKQKHWQLDATAKTATHLTNSPLILNSFTKSYIIRHAADAAMKASGASSLVLNIGGDMVIMGYVNETVNISNPKADAENDAPIDHIVVHERAVATSGNYRRGELIKGQWYSHIVDPRSGMPASEIISATVIAPSATDAGALATSFNVLSVEESIKLASELPDVDYLLITKDGRRIESRNWPAIATSKELAITSADLWNKGFELAINLELNLIKDGRVAQRPFVAIWVEDKDKNVVRNISLWYNRPRWLKDLHEWYRINNEKFTADNTSFASVTSATRSPGKYTMKWDGKDEKGEFAKPGSYTVCIEVAREHGTYQIIRQEIECNKTARLINLTGNVEIASASLDYRKKPNTAE